MLRVAVFLALFASACTERALEIPLDLAPDLTMVDLASVDLAHVDMATPVSDLAVAPDLADLGPPAPIPPVDHIVFAHSSSTLYYVDPDTLLVTEIAPFGWPGGTLDSMTDIALDRHGRMIGVSFSGVYAIDPATAKCTFLAVLDTVDMNGLSFVAGSDPNAEETLIGTTGNDVYRLDPQTGAQTLVGSWNPSWASSGDVVSVEGATYATVLDPFGGGDLLIRVNPQTGAAVEIGNTGVANIWGLGYWKNQVYGFTESNGIVLLDVNTAQATPLPGTSNISFWGAGVVTTAPTQ